jgi:hypothetical protein
MAQRELAALVPIEAEMMDQLMDQIEPFFRILAGSTQPAEKHRMPVSPENPVFNRISLSQGKWSIADSNR